MKIKTTLDNWDEKINQNKHKVIYTAIRLYRKGDLKKACDKILTKKPKTKIENGIIFTILNLRMIKLGGKPDFLNMIEDIKWKAANESLLKFATEENPTISTDAKAILDFLNEKDLLNRTGRLELPKINSVKDSPTAKRMIIFRTILQKSMGTKAQWDTEACTKLFELIGAISVNRMGLHTGSYNKIEILKALNALLDYDFEQTV